MYIKNMPGIRRKLRMRSVAIVNFLRAICDKPLGLSEARCIRRISLYLIRSFKNRSIIFEQVILQCV